MYCHNCGHEVNQEAVICINCGAATKIIPKNNADARPGCLLNGVSFIAPIVGLVLYLVWYSSMPIKAKSVGKWALAGVITLVVFYYVTTYIINSVVQSAVTNIEGSIINTLIDFISSLL